jgi:hypothetical protein
MNYFVTHRYTATETKYIIYKILNDGSIVYLVKNGLFKKLNRFKENIFFYFDTNEEAEIKAKELQRKTKLDYYDI